jgi:hypothetical protein
MPTFTGLKVVDSRLKSPARRASGGHNWRTDYARGSLAGWVNCSPRAEQIG